MRAANKTSELARSERTRSVAATAVAAPGVLCGAARGVEAKGGRSQAGPALGGGEIRLAAAWAAGGLGGFSWVAGGRPAGWPEGWPAVTPCRTAPRGPTFSTLSRAFCSFASAFFPLAVLRSSRQAVARQVTRSCTCENSNFRDKMI